MTMFTLQGRTALVTGATGHLGQEMARGLAAAGARVLVNSRDAERADALVRRLREEGFAAEALVFDVAEPESIEAALERRGHEPLHVLVNNAYAGGAGTIAHSEGHQYVDSYEVSVVAAHNLVRAALPALRAAVERDGDASVINIASMYGVVSPDLRVYDASEGANPPFYGAAKAALLQWTRYAACEFGREGIRFNSISPGPFPSGKVQAADPAFTARLAARVALGRVGKAGEIGGPVLFLASSASSYVNGANLAVDGGWTVW
jgi:NAD(P)-dependent dehydrogenase (short-subunit alcohol dehydrogenase family)